LPVTRQEARLANGLSATTLTVLDFNQLDSYERFHQLILNPPFPSLAWRDSLDFHGQPFA
jgi:ligand-binding SRPBCC domain-containing protein